MPVINMVPDGPAGRYSGSVGQKVDRSDRTFVEIPLKRKYLVGGTAPKQNKHSDNQGTGAHRHKLTAKQKAALPKQPVMVRVVDLRDGYSNRMMTAREFGQLSWGWEIE